MENNGFRWNNKMNDIENHRKPFAFPQICSMSSESEAFGGLLRPTTSTCHWLFTARLCGAVPRLGPAERDSRTGAMVELGGDVLRSSLCKGKQSSRV